MKSWITHSQTAHFVQFWHAGGLFYMFQCSLCVWGVTDCNWFHNVDVMKHFLLSCLFYDFTEDYGLDYKGKAFSAS